LWLLMLLLQVPPVVTHAKLGTLYEEPCIVYIKVRPVMLRGLGCYSQHFSGSGCMA
jgi:hypothetical protein